MSEGREFDRESIERTLCQIPEVEAARIVAHDDSVIDEIHVVALSTKGPKQIVRDVESTLMARFGLPIDHKKISIAQINTEPNGNHARAASTDGRLVIASLNTEVTGTQARVTVELELAGQVYAGSAEGLMSQHGALRLAALASLAAAEKFAGDHRFGLEDVAVTTLGSERAAVVCISIVTSMGEQRHSGSALVRQTDSDAVVKATLDAINRRFGILTSPIQDVKFGPASRL